MACSIMRRRLVCRTDRHRGRQRLTDLLEQALGLVEPRAEIAHERVELADQSLLIGELDVDIEPAFVVGIARVSHRATIARSGPSPGGRPRSTSRPDARSTGPRPRRSGT